MVNAFRVGQVDSGPCAEGRPLVNQMDPEGASWSFWGARPIPPKKRVAVLIWSEGDSSGGRRKCAPRTGRVGVLSLIANTGGDRLADVVRHGGFRKKSHWDVGRPTGLGHLAVVTTGKEDLGPRFVRQDVLRQL